MRNSSPFQDASIESEFLVKGFGGLLQSTGRWADITTILCSDGTFQHPAVDKMEGKDLSTGSYAITTMLLSEEDGICLHIIHWYLRTREEALCRKYLIVAFLVAETLLVAAASGTMVSIPLAAQL